MSIMKCYSNVRYRDNGIFFNLLLSVKNKVYITKKEHFEEISYAN